MPTSSPRGHKSVPTLPGYRASFLRVGFSRISGGFTHDKRRAGLKGQLTCLFGSVQQGLRGFLQVGVFRMRNWCFHVNQLSSIKTGGISELSYSCSYPPATTLANQRFVGWISAAHPPSLYNGGCAALIHPTFFLRIYPLFAAAVTMNSPPALFLHR